MREKKKKGLESKKLEPKETPPPIKIKGEQRKLPTLAEFGLSQGLNLKGTSKGGAPKINGWLCSAAWEVIPTEEQKTAFEEVAKILGNVVTLWHGTATRNITDIAQEGLQPGRASCMFGAGIYLGPPDKAFCYTNSSMAKRSWSHGQARYLLEVRAVLGKPYVATAAEKWHLHSLREKGFDSVAGWPGVTKSWGGTLRASENVVYSPSQVMVLRVLEYQESGDKIITPRTGRCEIVKQRAIDVPDHARAFVDLISRVSCGATAAVEVLLTNGTRSWVCNHCITTRKLKVGSTFERKTHKGLETVKIQQVL